MAPPIHSPPVSCLVHAVGYTESGILSDGLGVQLAAKDLATFIDMDILGIKSYAVGKDVDSGPGWSVTAVITTSHIAIHTWPEQGFVMADIVSCKPYDQEAAVNWLAMRFIVECWHRLIRYPEESGPWEVVP